MNLLGKTIQCNILTKISNDSFEVFSHSLSNSKLILKTHSTQLYQSNDIVETWVFKIFKDTIFLSDSNFGRLPASDRMRPRYIKSINNILSLRKNNLYNISPDDFSEIKGIFNRCLRKDQWDWFSIYSALNFPPEELLVKLIKYFSKGREVLKSNTFDYHEFCYHIDMIINNLINLQSVLITESESLVSAKRFKSLHAEKNSVSNEQINDENDIYIISKASKAKLERANNIHSNTLKLLNELLLNNGYITQFNQFIDLFCRIKTGPAIFEVKSISTDNERSQIRHAISQLYEYRYLHNLQEASLWLVLSNKPKEKWLIEYLSNDRNINIIWLEENSFCGPNIKLLT